MKLWPSFKIAFSLYSKIPMPHTEWIPQNVSYALGFLPLVGIPIGGLLFFWQWISLTVPLHPCLFAAGACAIPFLVTGGIHLDGFCDTIDALSSHQPKEKKWEILRDPHIGSFAMLAAAIYFLLLFGGWCQLSETLSLAQTGATACIYPLSRSIAAGSAVLLRPAKSEGMLHTVSQASSRRAVLWLTGGFAALSLGGMLALQWKTGLSCLAVCAVISLYYYRMACRQFGGVTGDLAGYFLQLLEGGMLGGAVLIQIVEGAM